MKQQMASFAGVLALCFVLGGCAEWTAVEGPVVPSWGITEGNVTLVEKPVSSACKFKGGIMGDTNPDVNGIPASLVELNQTIREGLASSAKRMGGNTVWIRTRNWQNPDLSTDYYTPFYVNNVEYTALVYDCPAGL